MDELTIYHNPRCSKSRQTLELLREAGEEPEIVLYLKHPPDAQAIRELLQKLGIEAGDLLRRNEAACRERGLGPDSPAEDIIAAMVEEPVLMERPVVVRGSRAVLGRPPENVYRLLEA